MKFLLLAFIISISIHFLLFKNYTIENNPTSTTSNTQVEKSSIHYVKLEKKQVEQKPRENKQKKVEKKEKPKKVKKEEVPKKVVKKEQTKKIEPKKTIKKEVIKKIEKKIIKQEKQKSLQDILLNEQIVNSGTSIQQRIVEDFTKQEHKLDPKILEQINKLYGDEFNSFTKVQKAFIKSNLNSFQEITQEQLNRMGYPRLAAKLRLSGANIVEFMFYPDGSIKDLKITTSSGYEIFDEYTLELIELAYKDYPKPKTPTKIKFNVSYNIY